MSGWHIGVIGDFDFAGAEMLEEQQEIAVASAFGEPSGPVTMGRIGAVRMTLLARSGAGRRLPPPDIDHRANIDVLKRCGVTDVVAISAVRAPGPDGPADSLVVIDQVIDHTGRGASFFAAGLAAQVDMADPVCSRLSDHLFAAAKAAGETARQGGCYIAIAGPQFPTRAECALFQSWGADVIGMDAMPEARLAREAELPYALLAMPADDMDGRVRRVLRGLAAALPEMRAPSPIDRTLDTAMVTAPEAWDRRVAARLDAVAGRVLRERRPDWF